MRRDELPVVLVSFCARDSDPYPRNPLTGRYVESDHSNPARWGPSLRLLADPRSELHGRVTDFYYLCHPTKPLRRERIEGKRPIDVAADTRAAIQRHAATARHNPRFHIVTWQTNRPPNDHADLFAFIEPQLRSIREAHRGALLVLQLSSGTDAMRSVMLLAGLVGIVDEPIRIVQAERNEGALARPNQPFADVELKIATVLRLARRAQPDRLLQDRAPTLEYDRARSPALKAAVAAALKAARQPFPILLRGERGVGKSTLAQLIRAAGSHNADRNDSWPSIACGQFADKARLMLELCGAKKGAYTDLKHDHVGLLELADRDVLFLDEVHDLDHPSQRAIIRTLEDGTYLRLGDSKRRVSRFRLITGTNQSDAVLGERLTPDFLDRLRDNEITIPPLRDCREDHPWMWRAVLNDVASRAGVHLDSIETHSSMVLDAIKTHPLPGNWRTLRRIAIRLLTHADGDETSRALARTVVFSVLGDTGASPPRMTSALQEPMFATGHDARYYKQLESTLGQGLQRFWDACSHGEPPPQALRGLLQDRDKERRAMRLIGKVFPKRLAEAGRVVS